MPEHVYNYDVEFIKHDTPFRAWFLGVFVTDGHLSKEGEVIIPSTDKQIIDIVVKNIHFKNKISIAEKSLKNPNWKNIYSIFLSKKIGRELYAMGFPYGRKTGKEIVPTCAKTKNFRHFLRGVVEGDGSFYLVKNGALQSEIVSASKGFLVAIQKILLGTRLIQGGSVKKDKRCNCFSLVFGHQDSVALGKFVYAKSKNMRLERKYKVYKAAKHFQVKNQMQKNRTCSIPGCTDPSKCKQLCAKHYYRLVKYPVYYKKHKQEINQRNMDRYYSKRSASHA